MKRWFPFFVGLWIFVGLIRPAHAQRKNTYTIEDSTFVRLSQKVTRAVQQDSTFNSYKKLGCGLKGIPIGLSPSLSMKSYFITTSDGCGWGASLGPLWIVSAENKTYRLLLYSGGYSIIIQNTLHQGLKDINIQVATAGYQSSKLYVFNGKKYISS